MLKINGFITNLGKYNEGELIGEWVQFPITEDEEAEILERIGINEEYEEYFFTDYESDIDLYEEYGEYVSIEELNELAETFEYLDESDETKAMAIMEVEGCTLMEALDRIDSYELYEGMTLEEYAYDIVNDCYNLPEFALRYFDYDGFARDLQYDGYYETDYGVLWSF